VVNGIDDARWKRFEGELPEDLEESRLLAVSSPQELPAEGEFDFVLCRDVINATQAPMAFLNELWHLATPGATLLLEAEVLTDQEHARLARFVPAAGWIPGRLTLRWMLEVSGFDVEAWLQEDADPPDARVTLRAVRSEREPASSTPP